jgi:hypothetical protein
MSSDVYQSLKDEERAQLWEEYVAMCDEQHILPSNEGYMFWLEER